ncbi:MAG TPA: hypothetical protein VK698_32885 [Kofleriaceae bacterium]|nr:hypothetical protein [Kofleriaceae bacterium]
MRNLSHAAILAAAFTALAPAAACSGDDDGDGSGDGSGDGGGGGGGLFDDPSDFDRGSCGPEAAVDAIDPIGIWHADLSFPDGAGVATFRVDPGASAGELTGLVYSSEAEAVRLAGGDLFLRREVDFDGVNQVFAIDLCRVEEDGSVSGQMAQCYGGDCSVGQIHGYRVARLDEPEAENMTLVSEWRGPEDAPWDETLTVNVRHRGTVAYLVGVSDGLHIVDLEDPAQPADLGHLPVAFPGEESFNDVKVYDAADGKVYAFLASDLRGVVVADVTDPTDPIEVLAFPSPSVGTSRVNVHTLFLEGDRLYVANISIAGVQIFDIAAPDQPVALGAYVHPTVGTFGGFVHDLSVRDGVAYLDYWNLGLVVVDTSDPAEPHRVGEFDDYSRRTSHSNWVTEVGGRRIAVHGDEDFDAHVRIIDVDPGSSTAFQEIGSYRTRPQVSVHNIMAIDELALVTYYQDGLRVLDLSDPEDPVEIAHFDSWTGVGPDYGRGFFEGGIGVDHDAGRDLVLLADTHRGLLVLTLDRPTAR